DGDRRRPRRRAPLGPVGRGGAAVGSRDRVAGGARVGLRRRTRRHAPGGGRRRRRGGRRRGSGVDDPRRGGLRGLAPLHVRRGAAWPALDRHAGDRHGRRRHGRPLDRGRRATRRADAPRPRRVDRRAVRRPPSAERGGGRPVPARGADHGGGCRGARLRGPPGLGASRGRDRRGRLRQRRPERRDPGPGPAARPAGQLDVAVARLAADRLLGRRRLGRLRGLHRRCRRLGGGLRRALVPVRRRGGPGRHPGARRAADPPPGRGGGDDPARRGGRGGHRAV
ncbi:MAG: hypothetical protein AVDCRST_MAG79-969, partial [uncultured Thermoleophilia bacterium]